jgi:hypothetical protein
VLRPPPRVLLAYRFFGWRVGPAYKDWVLDDIVRPGWLVRQGAPALAAVLVVGAGTTAVFDGDGARLLTLVAVLAAAGAFLRTSLRERALRQQGLNAAGDRLEAATWYDDETARRRRNLIGTAGTILLVVAGLTLLAIRSAT